ncbi:MAG: TlpA family protein disulfide reductase [Synergistaceae bacterium]|jgi:thiol-disulfide isomerase/thioredoxin|nr:TlpA family protein disulfide reductase [Synergistaceae bacterium]
MFTRSVSKILILVLLFAAISAFVFSRANAAGVFPAFTSKTLDGNTITNKIFANKKLTMVNIWATWCPPCVSEMPDLGRLGKSMPEGTQLIGLVYDVTASDQSAKGEANRILSGAKALFTQIEYSKDMTPYMKGVDAIPTTIFVDSKGNIIGEPLVGSRPEKEYRAAIEKALASLR